MRRWLAAALALSCGAALAATHDAALVAGVFTPPRAAPDFTLRGSDGHALQLGHYRGKVVLLAFGYSSCREVCPVTLAILAHARRQLGSAANDVQVVYITVDPERDDVARMHQFLALFDPTFVGGSGSPAELAAVRRLYGITVTRHDTPDGYVLAHSSFVYLIDRRGMLRALMPFGHGVDDFAHDMALLAREPGPGR
ncbi:MAG TPA: SCO family protein [Steroidobacteraceae bacterium]|nr:SCO family protein [Steroidobacteraceae bacterium]